MAPTTDIAGCRERALKVLGELPPFSPVLDRLLATLSSESVSISKIAEIIEKDTVIAGNVLKLVNSSLYGRRGTVNSVRHAVSLLGINKLRNAVFAMSISRMWSQVRTAPGWSTARFNLHSVACGLICDTLAQRFPIEYPEGAFASGLFHDLGELLIAVGLPEEFSQIRELRKQTRLSLSECELEVIGVSHADLSAEALNLWNLPRPIQDAVSAHHLDPPRNRNSRAVALGVALRCSDDYVNLIGISLQKEDEPEDECPDEPFAPIGVTLDSATFLDEFSTELQVLGGVFHS